MSDSGGLRSCNRWFGDAHQVSGCGVAGCSSSCKVPPPAASRAPKLASDSSSSTPGAKSGKRSPFGPRRLSGVEEPINAGTRAQGNLARVGCHDMLHRRLHLMGHHGRCPRQGCARAPWRPRMLHVGIPTGRRCEIVVMPILVRNFCRGRRRNWLPGGSLRKVGQWAAWGNFRGDTHIRGVVQVKVVATFRRQLMPRLVGVVFPCGDDAAILWVLYHTSSTGETTLTDVFAHHDARKIPEIA